MNRLEIIHGDRREDRRYEHEMDLRFTYEQDGVTYFGAGHTVDLSRGGVRFRTDTPPPQGVVAELRISWPFLLQNVCPLELMVWGSILTNDDRGTVLRMSRHEFRTCGQRSFVQATAGVGGSSILA